MTKISSLASNSISISRNIKDVGMRTTIATLPSNSHDIVDDEDEDDDDDDDDGDDEETTRNNLSLAR